MADRFGIMLVLLSLLPQGVPAAFAAESQIVIAHRGASGYLPEHTLEAYAMAYGLGADYIEPDVVLTKDGHFICLHDIHLDATTNVEEVFPDRGRKDGRYYAADFSLAEIKSLRAVERLEKRFPKNQSSFEVPSLVEMIELIQGLNKSTGRRVGIYPELKQPSWHAKEGLPMEAAFFAILKEYGYTEKDSPIFIQCFEAEPLRTLRDELGCRAPQVFLMGSGKLTDEDLRSIAIYAEGIGPSKRMIERDPAVVVRAHARGLLVHPYTFRADEVPSKYPNVEAELKTFYEAYGVDGVFTDFTDVAKRVLDGAGR
jgi:glycerophosphoryl diester phosphodiesterase